MGEHNVGDINIVIVGHDLEAKCDVANTFFRHGGVFRQFQCRQKLQIRQANYDRMEGLPACSDRQIYIVVTPNLNTPAWTYRKKDGLPKLKNKAFVYVESPSKIYVNHQSAIRNIKTDFQNSNAYSLTYKRVRGRDDNKISDNYTIDRGWDIKEKRRVLNKLLEEILKGIPPPVANEQNKERTKAKYQVIDGENIDEAATEAHDRDDRSAEILDDDFQTLFRTIKYGKAKSNHVRANVIGNQTSGKTTIIKRLHSIDVKCPDAKQLPTEALEISSITSMCIEVDGVKQWESRDEGYCEALNSQRMTQAVQQVTGKSSEISGDEKNKMDSSYEEAKIRKIMKTGEARLEYVKKVLQDKSISSKEEMYISYWDFAGQSTYYSTHQLFMSPSAVYVLVVDLSKDFKSKVCDKLGFRSGIINECTIADSLLFWVSSIKAFTTDEKGGKAPMIIVGTHIDKLKEIAEKKNIDVEREIMEKFDEIKRITRMSEVQCIAIDNTDPDNDVLNDLRNQILELGLGVMDEEISAQWIDLDIEIQKLKKDGKVFMNFTELQELDKNMTVPMEDKDRLEAFLRHQHSRGHLIYFSREELKNIIILAPTVLAKFLNHLMRSRDLKNQKDLRRNTGMQNYNGFVNDYYIKEVANLMTEFNGMDSHVDTLIQVLIRMWVIRPFRHVQGGYMYILPCLLPRGSKEEEIREVRVSVINRRRFEIKFDDPIPPTFFHLLLGSLFNEWGPIEKDNKLEVFNLYACLNLGMETQQMLVFWEDSKVYFDLNQYSRRNLLTEDQVFGILTTVNQRLEDIFLTYGQSNRNFQVLVRCPVVEHHREYVSVKQLQENGEAMCFSTQGRHVVYWNDVFRREFPLRASTLADNIFKSK